MTFIIGVVCIAAVSWEGFEWILGRLTGSLYQATLDNTMEDLFVGLGGGIIACPIVLIRNFSIAKTLDVNVESQSLQAERRMSA